MWFHLSWTEVVDNVTTSVCCEQLSLKTQPVLSIMYTNLWICVMLVQKEHDYLVLDIFVHQKVQVGKDQEKAQSEKDSHSKNRGGKKPN